MKKLLALMLCLAGCSSGASTEVDPSKSSVKSKTTERRAVETESTKVTVTSPPDSYRLKIKVNPCSPSSLPLSLDK